MSVEIVSHYKAKPTAKIKKWTKKAAKNSYLRSKDNKGI